MNIHKIALGNEKANIVLKNCRMVNVLTHQIEDVDIAIHDGIIVGVGSYQGITEIDLKNQFVSPGFIDSHVHIESSMLTPSEFSKVIIPKGTTRVIADPHEIANVKGVKGIGFMFKSSTDTPLHVHIMIPSCVPSTMFESNGADISNEDVYSLKDREGILGLGEVMDYPSVIHAHNFMMDRLKMMDGKPIDGHAPLVSGKELNSYLLGKIRTDHECTNVTEMHEKMARGMYIHLREGSATRNVSTLIEGITPHNSHRAMFCTDDKHLSDILEEGHINYNVNLSISKGTDPITAIQMATINPATCYQLNYVGAIAPGYVADLIVFDDLYNIQPSKVIISGDIVYDQELLFETRKYENIHVTKSVKLNTSDIDLSLSLSQNKVKVMQLIPNNITTNQVIREVTVRNGKYVNNDADDILKIAVIERHHYTGNVGIGLIEGYGLKNGAVAMTIAHDSHNIIVVGDNDEDMLLAVKDLKNMQGGLTIVSNGEVLDHLALEIAGLMTNQSIDFVQQKLLDLEKKAHELGVNDAVDDAFLSLAFMALPVIPDLKLTDQGLFDVRTFQHVSIEGDSE
jgi:adenine deaminase